MAVNFGTIRERDTGGLLISFRLFFQRTWVFSLIKFSIRMATKKAKGMVR
jgi:hypothetical protein